MEGTRETFEQLTHAGMRIDNELAKQVAELLQEQDDEIGKAWQKLKEAEADAGAFERAMQQASLSRHLLELRLKRWHRVAPWLAVAVSVVTAAAVILFGAA